MNEAKPPFPCVRQPPDAQQLAENAFGDYFGGVYAGKAAPWQIPPMHVEELRSELAHLHSKLDRVLALQGDRTLTELVTEAKARCKHQPGTLESFCQKCGCQIQAPLPPADK